MLSRIPREILKHPLPPRKHERPARFHAFGVRTGRFFLAASERPKHATRSRTTTPKEFTNKAQGREQSERTLGVGHGKGANPNGVLQATSLGPTQQARTGLDLAGYSF